MVATLSDRGPNTYPGANYAAGARTLPAMNVLQVSKYYYPEVGGIERVVRNLAEGFRGTDDVRVVAATKGGVGDVQRPHGVPVRKVTTLAELLSVPISPTFPLVLAKEMVSADVVHVHLPNPAAVASYLAAAAAIPASRRPSLVVTYHSDIVRQSTALGLYEPLLHRFLSRADRVVVTSPGLLEHSEHLESHAENCTVVPLSIDPDEYGEYDGPSFDLPTDPDRPTALFVGRLNYYKGLDHLVDAVAQIDQAADVLVVGDGDQRQELERRAADRGVTDRVSFLGRVPDRKLRYCYHVADLFVLPSVERSEAFGMVQLEAMAAGLPVVNTALPTGVPWVSVDGETGRTVEPGDASALADAMDELLASPDLRRRYGEAARDRVERKFSRERKLSDVATVYESVTESKSAR